MELTAKLFGSVAKNLFFNRKIKTMKLLGDLLHRARRPHALDQLTGDLVPAFAKPALPLVARFDKEKYGPFLNRMGAVARSASVLRPHAYDFYVDTPAYKYASDSRVGGLFDIIAENQRRLRMPVMVGEWGGGGRDRALQLHGQSLHARIHADAAGRRRNPALHP